MNKKTCSICGKVVKGKCFETKIPKKYFDGWAYRVNAKTMKIDDVKYKNTFYKVIGYTKIQREIVYFVWRLFHRKEIDFVECAKCLKKH